MKKASIYSSLLLIIFLLIWEGLAKDLSELILPAPSVVFTTLMTGLKTGYYTPHLIRTILEIVMGLLLGSILGLLAGICMGEIKFVRQLLFPYVIASQAVPKLALAPLFILWFGFGMTSKVVITALICFFPIMESAVTAIRYTDTNKVELFRVIGASRWQTLYKLRIPAGLPTILAGFRVAAVLAVVGAVVGEFIGASEGLGALIIASQGMMDTPLMFSVLILVTIIGTVLYQIFYLLERKLLHYKKR
jgi:NitT/TauT family transport system permease protein